MDKPMMALVVGVVSAVIAGLILAFMHIGGSPGDSSGDKGTQNSVSSSPCVLVSGSVENCTSSDPEITLDGLNESSTYACRFSYEVNWGDGSPDQVVDYAGGPQGPYFVASHMYNGKGTFSIDVTGQVTYGLCTTLPDNFTFTLG